jgi:hypothetical protein
MEALAVAAVEDIAANSGLEEGPCVSVEDDVEMLAFELWKRASCEGAADAPCADIEESVLAPH